MNPPLASARGSRRADRRTRRRHRGCHRHRSRAARSRRARKSNSIARPSASPDLKPPWRLALELVHAGRLSLMRMVELFTTGPARVLGRKRAIAVGRAGRPHDFFHRRPLDVSRQGFGQQIAQHAVRRPHVPRRSHGHYCGGGRIVYRRERLTVARDVSYLNLWKARRAS